MDIKEIRKSQEWKIKMHQHIINTDNADLPGISDDDIRFLEENNRARNSQCRYHETSRRQRTVPSFGAESSSRNH